MQTDSNSLAKVLSTTYGAPQSEDEERDRAQRPMLCINSEAFMYWPNNFEAVLTLCEGARASGALSWPMTVRGTVHPSLSDFSVLYPRIFSLFLKATANSHSAIILRVNASLEFLKFVMHENISTIVLRSNEELLSTLPLDKLPNEHKLINTKWIAMRLRIPHE
jgi:platelet-activating factor acetylhydrolase